MKKINVLITLIVLAIATVQVGCNDDSAIQTTTTDNSDTDRDVETKEQLDKVLLDLAPAEQSFTKDASGVIEITGEQGFEFTFYNGAFVDANGDAVTGNIEIKLMEITNVAQMLGSGITTVQGSSLLSSGGMFKIEAFQGSKELDLAPGAVYSARIPNDGSPDFSMQIFEGVETGNEENPITWDEANRENWINWQDSSARDSMYNMNLNFLRWCNLDKYFNSGLPLTKLSVKLPSDYTNKNTNVFLFIEEDNGATALMGDQDKEEFNTGSYQIPEGFKIKIIIIGEIDDELYYHIISTTVTTDHSETVVESDMTQISKDDLEEELEKLK